MRGSLVILRFLFLLIPAFSRSLYGPHGKTQQVELIRCKAAAMASITADRLLTHLPLK
jgi:hypothetical protein